MIQHGHFSARTELVLDRHLDVQLERLVVDVVLQLALLLVERLADGGGLLVVGGGGQLGGELGLQWPLRLDDQLRARVRPGRVVRRRDGDHRLGQVAHLDLRGHLALDERKDRFIQV